MSDPFEHSGLAAIDERAPMLRDVGARVEANPEDWRPLWEDDLIRSITLMEVPAPWNPRPNCGGWFGPSPMLYPLQIAIAERIARADASCVLAMPTPTMAGHAVATLGNEAQKAAYFSRYEGTPRRSFFAVTEPSVGSDATGGESAVSDDGARLTVRKKLVGSAAQADFGLVFARASGGRGHCLVTAGASVIAQLSIERLPMSGLAGADLTAIEGDDVALPEGAVLGHGLRRGLRDGFHAMNAVFERYRPVVAALAAGTARGLLDDLAAAGVPPARIEPLVVAHAAVLDRLSAVAAAYERSTPRAHETSALKLAAIGLLEEAVALVFAALPPAELFGRPGLLKRCRDARAFEYMEGTSNVHRLQAYRGVAAGMAA